MSKVNWRSCAATTVARARRFYEAYTRNSDNLNVQGFECPAWDALNDQVKSHWCAVALESLATIIDHDEHMSRISNEQAALRETVRALGEIVVIHTDIPNELRARLNDALSAL